MKTFKEMIEAYRNIQDIEHKIKKRLEKIVNETICPIASIERFSISEDGLIDFRYEMDNGQGHSYSEEESFPVEWLYDRFDYKTAFKERCEQEKKRFEDALRKAREAEEYARYQELKNKFENY